MADETTLLYTKLSGSFGVSALVSNRIYPGTAPQANPGTLTAPFIVFFRVSGPPLNVAYPASTGDVQSRWQVECVAPTHAQAWGVAAAVATELEGWRDLTLAPKVQSTLLLDQRDAFATPTDGGDEGEHRVILDFSIWTSLS